MQSINQLVFSEITGFEGSWRESGASQEGFEDEPLQELMQRCDDTLLNLDSVKNCSGKYRSKTIAYAIKNYVNCTSGLGLDLDNIYLALEDCKEGKEECKL